jgi:hypothetical protein
MLEQLFSDEEQQRPFERTDILPVESWRLPGSEVHPKPNREFLMFPTFLERGLDIT